MQTMAESVNSFQSHLPDAAEGHHKVKNFRSDIKKRFEGSLGILNSMKSRLGSVRQRLFSHKHSHAKVKTSHNYALFSTSFALMGFLFQSQFQTPIHTQQFQAHSAMKNQQQLSSDKQCSVALKQLHAYEHICKTTEQKQNQITERIKTSSRLQIGFDLLPHIFLGLLMLRASRNIAKPKKQVSTIIGLYGWGVTYPCTFGCYKCLVDCYLLSRVEHFFNSKPDVEASQLEDQFWQ